MASSSMASPMLALYVGLVLVLIWVGYRLFLSFGKKEGFFGGGQSYKLVMYYADWCGHCKRAKPEIAKLGATQTISGKTVDIVLVNADKEQTPSDVKGYPTIRLLNPSGVMVKEYNGPRTTDGFLQFLKENVV